MLLNATVLLRATVDQHQVYEVANCIQVQYWYGRTPLCVGPVTTPLYIDLFLAIQE